MASRKQWAALGVLLLGAFMGFLDIFIVNVANPAIQRELHASFAEIQLVPGGYTLAYAAGLVTGGRLGDLYGRRRVFLAGTVAFGLASVACAAAPSPAALIGARVAQGLAAAAMLPQVLALAQVTFRDPAQRARAIGLYGAVIGAGAVAGQIVGGLLLAWDVAGLGWRAVFLINVPLCALTFAGARALVRDGGERTAARLDLGGVLLLGAGLFALVHACVVGPEQGRPGRVAAELAAGAALLGLFAGWERRVARSGGAPLVPPRLFRRRGFSLGLPTALLFYGVNGAFVFVLAFHLQYARGLTPLESALAFTPMAVLTSVFATLGGRLTERLGPWTVPGSAVVMTLGLLAVWAAVETTGPGGAASAVTALMPGLVLYGAGGGVVATSLTGLTLSGVAPEDAGAASGSLLTAVQASEAAGVAALGALFATRGFGVVVLTLGALSAGTAVLLRALVGVR